MSHKLRRRRKPNPFAVFSIIFAITVFALVDATRALDAAVASVRLRGGAPPRVGGRALLNERDAGSPVDGAGAEAAAPRGDDDDDGGGGYRDAEVAILLAALGAFAVALAVALFRWLRRRAQLRSLAKFLSDEPVAIAYAPATQRESLGDDDAERRVSPARRRAESLA